MAGCLGTKNTHPESKVPRAKIAATAGQWSFVVIDFQSFTVSVRPRVLMCVRSNIIPASRRLIEVSLVSKISAAGAAAARAAPSARRETWYFISRKPLI